MKFSTVVTVTLLSLVTCSASVFGEEGSRFRQDEKYNVVLITVNSLRYDRLGSSGYPKPTTPAMDELAEKAFVFTRAFAQTGYTMPNIMTIFTSLYPQSHQVMDSYKDKLSSRVKTIAEIFRENGYETAGFWRHGIPHIDVRAGFGRGFDLVGDLRNDYYGRQAMLNWLRERKNRPFFMAVNTRSTHVPYIPLQEYRGLVSEGRRGDIIDNQEDYDRAVYRNVVDAVLTPGSSLYGLIDPRKLEINAWLFDGEYLPMKIGMIRSLIPAKFRERLGAYHMDTFLDRVDQEDPENMKYFIGLYDACVLEADQELVRPILELIKELGVGDRTIVVLTSEHGVGLGEHSILAPGSLDYYDEMIHVPLIIKAPFSSDRKDMDALVQAVDLMPTILELAGIPVPAQAQGKSLMPMMKGKKSGPPLNEAAIGSTRERAFIRTRRWKLILYRKDLHLPESERDELYDLYNDPAEKINVRDAHREVYADLRGRVRKHLESVPRYVDQVYTFPEYVDELTRKKIKETGYW